jgi:hypothetical protein
MVVDLRRVEAGDGDARKEVVEQRRTGFSELVQHERAAGEFSEDGEQACAGRRLQHPVSRRNGGGSRCGESEHDRRRELLQGLAFLGAARMGGEKARDLGQHRQHGGRRRGPGADGRAKLSQKQDRGRLAGVIGGLPIPGAGRIGGAAGGLHRAAQDAGVDAPSAFEIGKKEPGGLGDGGGCRRCRCGRKQWRSRTGGRGVGSVCHERYLGRAGTGRAAGRSLDPTGSNPSRPISRSLHAAAFTVRHQVVRALKIRRWAGLR